MPKQPRKKGSKRKNPKPQKVLLNLNNLKPTSKNKKKPRIKYPETTKKTKNQSISLKGKISYI